MSSVFLCIFFCFHLFSFVSSSFLLFSVVFFLFPLVFSCSEKLEKPDMPLSDPLSYEHMEEEYRNTLQTSRTSLARFWLY